MNYFRRRELKYNNRTTKGLDGYTYHSALEAAVSNLLLLRQKAGELIVIARQQHIHFFDMEVKLCEYWPDFTVKCPKTGDISWIEAKGLPKPEWVIKLNLWRVGGPGRLDVWTGDWKKPKLSETVYPIATNSRVHEEQVFSKLRGKDV